MRYSEEYFFLQVFSQARVFFSIGGRHYSGEPVHFSYVPDLMIERARNVTVKLHSRIGKYVKLQLWFAAKWIMLSEISFDSGRWNFDIKLYFCYCSAMFFLQENITVEGLVSHYLLLHQICIFENSNKTQLFMHIPFIYIMQISNCK